MKHTGQALISLLIIAAVSLGVLWGGDRLTRTLLEEQESSQVGEIFGEWLPAKRFDPLSTDGWEQVNAAYRALDEDGNVLGYAVTVTVAGYVGDIEVHTALAADGGKVMGIRIGSHRETAGYGARIASTVFTDQFTGADVPLSLTGAATGWQDGTYRAEAAEADSGGFRDVVELTIQKGAVSSVNWDAVTGDGTSKKELSRSGQYVMSETGLAWHEQAQIMEQALLQTQSADALIYNTDTGTTDAYSGATIRVEPFIKLARQALQQAAGDNGTGTAVDGLSGATASSKAVVAAVNQAATFVAERLK